MSAPSQPLKDPSGDHPPGISYRLTCTGNDGVAVTLSDGKVTVEYDFNGKTDANYFVVGQNYVVFAAALGG